MTPPAELLPPEPTEKGERLVISRGWRKALLTAATVLSLVLLGLGTSWAVRLGRAPWNPESCGACHAMQPEFVNWRQGPHSQVGCVQCHGRVDLPRFTFANMTGSYRHPVEATDRVPTSACLTCHRFDRQITPTKDLIIQHSFHVKMNLDCQNCHAYLVHGPPGGNLEMVAADFSQRVPMARCRTCHNGTMAPGECTTCHADANKPAAVKVVSRAPAQPLSSASSQ